MKTTQPSKSQQLRARLDHPIIDSDRHTFELAPLFTDYLKSVAGAKVVERFEDRLFRYLCGSALEPLFCPGAA